MNTPHHLPQNKYLDLLIDAVCIVSRESVFLFVSAAGERIFGYSPAEMIGKAVLDLVHPDDKDRTLQAIEEIHEGEIKPHFENRYVRKDGSVAHIMWSARWSDDDQVRVAVARDVTSLKRAEAQRSAVYAISEAAHAAEDLQALFKRIHEIVIDLLPASHFFLALHDADSDQLSFPYSTTELDGMPSQARNTRILCAEVIRREQALLLTPETSAALLANAGVEGEHDGLDWLGVPLLSTGGLIGALVMQNPAGAVRYTEQDKELLQYVSIQVAAAIERKRTQSRLLFMAQHDSLTGLPNRALFLDRLQNALARARREKSRLAVLFVDIDEFKGVNDTLGHTVGDKLLQGIALRLKRSVRESDTVGRLGGDEFVVVLNGIENVQDAFLVAEKILAELGLPHEIHSTTLQVSPSIGVAVFPDDGENGKQLVRSADEAMYRAKRNGGNRHSGQVLGDSGLTASVRPT